MNVFEKLAAPFPPDQVHWRVGSTNKDKTKGMALAYLDARDVMDRLDAVVGPANWQCRYPHANGKTVCEIGINVVGGPQVTFQGEGQPLAISEGCWVWKADGAGDTDHEAEKGALSDAFKRAAVRWGIGRYLYDLGNIWVEIEPFGRSYKIKDSELPKLRRRLPNAPKEQVSAPVQPTGADKAGGESPPGSPPADEFGLPPIDAAKSYVALAKTAMMNCTTVQELDEWWINEGPEREKHGIKGGRDKDTGKVFGTPEYMELLDARFDLRSRLAREAA